MALRGRQGEARRGAAGQGEAGMAWQGLAGLGRRGGAGQGEASQGRTLKENHDKRASRMAHNNDGDGAVDRVRKNDLLLLRIEGDRRDRHSVVQGEATIPAIPHRG